MLTEERHSMIIKAVNERASVTITELSEILNVAPKKKIQSQDMPQS